MVIRIIEWFTMRVHQESIEQSNYHERVEVHGDIDLREVHAEVKVQWTGVDGDTRNDHISKLNFTFLL
jgi:hypothetical protein